LTIFGAFQLRYGEEVAHFLRLTLGNSIVREKNGGALQVDAVWRRGVGASELPNGVHHG
jgi:hypothetical protein